MAEEDLAVNLRILSPSSEIDGGINFPDLPTSTTISELRSRIQDAIPSKPAGDRMRLIYRGRVVASDSCTLAQIFGTDGIRESKDQSLHLVLRELASNTSVPTLAGTRSVTTTPSRPQPQPQSQPPTSAGSPLQTNPFRSIGAPRTQSQPHGPQPHNQNIQGPTSMPVQGQANGAGTIPPATFAQAYPHPPAQMPPFAPTNLPIGGGNRTVRQEGIGPNGERWSVTINQSNTTIPDFPPQFQNSLHPRAPQLPPGFGQAPQFPLGSAQHTLRDRAMQDIRGILQRARMEMEDIRTLYSTPDTLSQPTSQATQPNRSSPPSWRLAQLRDQLRIMTIQLDMVERGLSRVQADPSMAQNPDVVAIRQTMNDLRSRATEMDQRIRGEQGNNLAHDASSHSGSSLREALSRSSGNFPSSTSLPAASHDVSATIPVDTPPELFILSSPQGPVGIVFDRGGTYTTAPMVSTLPYQTFTTQFAQNRQLITGLGQRMGQGPHHFQLADAQPTPTQPLNANANGHVNNQAQNNGQVQNGQGIAREGQVQNAQEGQDRLADIAGHLWLIFKLACFVYFFAAGGGLYRPIMLGIIAAAVYLAQIGIFEEQFILVRRHLEALLPTGALGNLAAAQNAANDPAPGQQRQATMGNLTPEQAAQRLLQDRRDQRFAWVRDSMRTVERSLALFIASLWPGIGERMVHAQEERARAERASEEERIKRETEEREKLQTALSEEQAQGSPSGSMSKGAEPHGSSLSGDHDEVASLSKKGKEKAGGQDNTGPQTG